MQAFSPVAWLYWNPRREAFTIPYFDIPVVWYGVLFATGFIVGYFLLIPIIQQFIRHSQRVYGRDVANWTILANFSQSRPDFSKALTRKARQELANLPQGTEPSASLKQALLDGLNALVESGTNRKALETLLAGAIAKARDIGVSTVDQLTWFIVLGTVIGARLGHVFFYDWPYYAAHPIEIIMIRHGGLASHGGTLGVLIGLGIFLYRNRRQLPDTTFLNLIDMLAVPTAFVAFCIRMGNFYNQEILGNETTVPWAIVFGNPADGTIPTPRHPVQLYEAGIYLATFGLLYTLWKLRGPSLKPGTLIGLFFILVFGSRFFIDFLKLPQSMMWDESHIQVGQLLSIPFVIVGLILLFKSRGQKAESRG